MCGIVGYSGDFLSSDLKQAVQDLAHRGPDDQGVFYDPHNLVGLGHSRLSILDLSDAGHQPMFSPCGDVVIVFNGEIYNFKELRNELASSGYSFSGDSDTEVLLKLYMHLGEAAIQKLNGIFSFALWDARKGTVLLVRDPMGVKPLYWSQTSEGVVFASELKAMVRFFNHELRLDASAVHRYLGYLWCPGERTAMEGVKKVLPGEALEIRRGTVTRKWTWFHLPISTRNTSKSEGDAQYWIDETRQKLREAVHRQMVADVPVGAFLSGGLDSSAVVALAKEIDPDIKCFSIALEGGQDEGTVDDLPYARRAANYLGLELEIVNVDSSRMARDLENMVFQLDEPLADPAVLNVRYISQLARSDGYKVLLSGAGGDDLFTGYRRHKALLTRPLWDWLPKRVLNCAEIGFAQLDQRNSYFRKLAKLFSGASLSGDTAISSYFLWAREKDLLPLYSADMREAISQVSLTSSLENFLQAYPADLPDLEKMLLLEQRFFLADHNLTYTDKMSMAEGVEARVPFLDLDLVEHAAKIPLHLKFRNGQTKWILKKAMEPYLPKEIIYRPKTGFGAPLRRWMKNELSELKHDTLSAESVKRRNIFDSKALERLIADDNAGKIDASYLIFSIMCIEIWCEKFLAQRT